MKKKVFGRQFKRDTNERKALFKGLMSELVMRESIQTTLPKAKSIKGQVEKLVTKAKVKGASSRPFIQPFVSSEAVNKIITNLAVRFVDRPGGYVRIVKLGSRFSDNADMAVIEWVERESELVVADQELSKESKTSKNKNKTKVESVIKVAKKNKESLKKEKNQSEKVEKKSSKKKGSK